MKTLIPFFAVLSACGATADLSPIREELASLRHDVQELRKAQAPSIEAVEAMDDLAREVKKLREKTVPPAAPLPPARDIPRLLPSPAGSLAGGVGGTQAGVNDLFWVLGRVALDGEDRTVLALYQALPRGGFKLAGVRWLGADLQVIEYGQDRPHVKDVLEALPKKK